MKMTKQELDEYLEKSRTHLPEQEEIFEVYKTLKYMQIFRDGLDPTDSFEMGAENVKHQVALLERAVLYMMQFADYSYSLEQKYGIESKYCYDEEYEINRDKNYA